VKQGIKHCVEGSSTPSHRIHRIGLDSRIVHRKCKRPSKRKKRKSLTRSSLANVRVIGMGEYEREEHLVTPNDYNKINRKLEGAKPETHHQY
jgi:hypothetical protein